MSGNFLARATAISLALFLAACGGDGDSTPLAGNGSGNGSGNGGAPDETPGALTVGSVQLLASPAQIDTSGTSNSSLTALIKDDNGVLLEDINVAFSVNNGGTLQVDQSTTDTSGSARASLSAAGDARNRTVTVSATAGGSTDTVDVLVSGTSITISGPTSISIGDTVAYRIALSAAGNNGIRDQVITATSNNNTIATSTLTTGENGVVEVNLTAETGGNDVLTVSAFDGQSKVSSSQTITVSPDSFAFTTPAPDFEIDLNSPQQVTVEWLSNGTAVADGSEVRFSATRGNLVPADGVMTTAGGEASIQISSANSGPAIITATDPDTGLSTQRSIEFVADTPDTINLQISKTQIDFGESVELTAIVRDAENNLVKNQNVTFQILEDGSSGSLSTSAGTTDTQGRATTTYTGGLSDSGRDGVEIQATVAGSIIDTTTLTVARQALRLVIGTGNEIFEPDEVRYRKPYVAIVTDANGAPVENAEVELSVLPIEYAKGSYAATDTTGNGTADSWRASFQAVCDTEDLNRNGIIDPGEDVNGNEKLDPTNPATTSAPSIVTATDGSADFQLLYPQSFCSWVKTRITATVRVGGTESIESSEFYLSCSADDLNDLAIPPPGGSDSPYGTAAACADPD